MGIAVRRPIPLFALAAVLSVLGGLCIGAFPVSVANLLSAFGLSSAPIDGTTATVLYAIRAPRVLAAFAVGAALAAGGAAMQSLFRNPLADPGLLGVSSGAALAAVTVIVLGEKVMHIVPPPLKPWLLPVAAFVGGLAATVVVYRLAARDGITLVGTLLLAGIAINAIAAAGIGMLVFIADEQQLRTLIFWTMGGFGAVTWIAILPALLVLAIAVPTLLPAAHLLDALALGEREAGHVGVDVERLKRRLVAQVALAVGASVAISGTVGFVGLVAPHIVRLLLGPAHRTLLPAAALFGGTFLVLADALARTVVSPAELPIGVLTALVGGPFFLWLLAGRAARSGL
ncbi:MAG: FecCD family ABC transporter permease [Reyranella sp.]|uniref:FecCD family ABC transporter permease n=1 Tax=Reyranella sp. TaxID=1929291 RepID=UPI003D108FBD